MSSGFGRLAKLAVLVCFDAALVLCAIAGIAQAAPGGPDFPKVPSTSTDDPPADEPPPPMPHSQRDAKQSQSNSAANRNQRTAGNLNDNISGGNRGANINGNGGNNSNGYNNAGNGARNNSANRNANAAANRSVANQAQWAADQRVAQIQYQTNAMAENYHSAQPYGYQAYPSQASYQPMQYGNSNSGQPKSGISSLFSSLGWQSNSNQRPPSGRMNVAEAPREAYVGPDAVYIDAEPIPAGRAPVQSSPVRFAPGQSSSGAMPGGSMSSGQTMGNPQSGTPMRPGQMPSVQAAPGQSSRKSAPQGQIMSEEAMPDGHMVEGPNGSMMDDGQMVEGDGPMTDGDGPMMQGGPHKFLNPYCNDCRCGQGCGGGCQTCNRGGNWITDGDENDFGDDGDCGCETCHRTGCSCDECPNCAGHHPGHFTYGRPWVLFPFDWLDTHLSDGDSGWWWGRDFTVFAGVHNFRNPVDLGVNSNFGFQEGVNFSFPVLTGCFNIAAQVGYEATQSDLDPSTVLSDRRMQSFLTAGLFHRNDSCVGWEFGATFDWLHDNFYQDFDLGQVRSEIGCWCNRCNEIGFTSSIGLWTDNTSDQPSPFGANSYSVIDQYFFFYRHKFNFGGDVRFGGGFTGRNGDNDKNCGLVGADFNVPLSCCLAVEGGFDYMLPGASTTNSISSETWNLGINLVWYPGSTAKCCCSPFRPLLNVADNGSLLVTRHGSEPR
ncbi:MAG TPA: DUF6666 family protein [Pirellulales bacterium]|jgi:hypothetical protein